MAYRHHIGVGSAQVIYTRWSTGTITTKYVTSDHLGSSTVVMDGAGASLVNLSFGSFGARRGSAWTGTPSAGDWTQIANATRQGFTGHEGLDNVNFIHMNGRVYEPVLGRFLSADPFTPASLGSQAPNRYAYIGNQTLSATDPSGYFPRNGNALKQWRNGPGTLDALELAINYSWNRWGGVRNVSDGLEGTHAGLLAHSMDVLARGGAVNGTTITAANVVWGSGSFGQSHINGIFALASARSSSRTSVAGGPSGAISGADGVTQLGEVVVTASRRGSSEQISWTPGRMSPSGPALVGSGHLSYGHRERDRFGPNSGTWVKILVGGADSMGALGVEGNAGIYFGRDLDGNFEAGLYDDSGFGLGLAASVDFAGFEVLTGLDSLDNSQSINIFGSAGPFSGHISLDRPNANVYSGQLNGYGANLSLGPIPVEAGVTFTTTRTWALFGGRR